MKRSATPGSGPPASRSRVDDDEDSGPTEFDVSFLREQNKQLAASLFGYKRRLQKTDAELNALRSKADGDAAVAQAVLRQWDVLNSDLLDMASAAGVEPPPEEDISSAASSAAPLPQKRPGRGKKASSDNGKEEGEEEKPMPGPGQLRRALSDGADHHLLVKVPPPASERDVLLAVKAQSACDDEDEDGDDNQMEEDEKGGSGGSSRRGEEDDARAERLNWVDATTRASSRRSQSLLAALLASPLFKGGASASAADSDAAGRAEAAAIQAMMKNRALRAEVELLRDRLEAGKKQASLDKATALAAQMEARHAQRALDLLRTASSLPSSSSSSLSSSLFTSEAATLERALSDQVASVSTPGGVQAARSSSDSALLAPGAMASASAAASAGASEATTSRAAAATPSAAGSRDSSMHPPSTPSGAAVVKSDGGGGGGGAEDAGGATAMKDDEVAEDLAALAATRLRHLEASRDEVARLESLLASAQARASSLEKTASALSNGSAANGANHELATKLQRALAEANREKAAARYERDSASRLAEDVKRLSDRATAAEARYDEWASSVSQEWSSALATAQKEHATTSSALKEAQTELARMEELEKEASGLREQVADYAKIVAEEQRRQGAARAEAARARQAEKSRAAEAEAARQLAEAATLVNGGGGGSGDSNGDASGGSQQNALAAAAARQRDAGQSAELESMKAMNEAMLSELEAMALAADDLSNQNVRLLQLAAERDDVNKLLMTKARQLRDVKGAEAHERQVLAHKLQASEQARVALEEVSKAREALLQASEQGRRDRDASMLIRDRDASACVAAGNRAAADLVEAKEAESKARAASSALEQRVAALAEESKQLKAQRDTLEEQSEASQRKLERALKKLEKAKQRGSSAHADGGLDGGEGGRSGGAEVSEDAEYRELLEFENENLKKQVMCPLLKEKVKSRILIKCGHAFSEAAIAQCMADRNRKCPACRKAFGADDVKPLFLTS